jgi:lysophospholipase L1-like esterase
MAPKPRAAASRLSAGQAAAAVIFSLVGVLALDGLLFRTSLYPSILEPDSSTGLFEMILARERAAQARYGANMVVTFGDSRFAYAPRLANEVTDRTGLVFRQAGVAGTDARSWYYMLRDLDPSAKRYRAVVIGVPDFDDEDEAGNPADDLRALHYVIARLRWSDIPEFAFSFPDRAARWQALRGSVLKGAVLQQDIRQFLSHPRKRLDYVALCRRGYEGWTYNYVETPRSMTGLAIDWATMTATFAPGAAADQRDTVRDVLLRPAQPQTGRVAAFRRQWLGRILDRYRGSPTRIVFVRLPRGAVPRPDGLVRKLSSSIREFAARPNVLLAPEHTFDVLERPELFQDAIHLNREGIARFSPMLADEIARILTR